MSRRTSGRLGDSKGAELLAQLKGQLASTPTSSPTPSPANGLAKDMQSTPRTKPILTPDAERQQRQIAKRKSKKAQKAGVTVIKPRNAAEREAYRLAKQGCTPKGAEPRPTEAASQDFGAAAYHQLRRLRENLEGFVANHRGPGDVPPTDREIILRRIKTGAAASSRIINPGEGYFLGYDFGTSTSKAVARYPHGGVDEAFAIDVPLSVASGGLPHLFPTAVWWDKESDRFALIPTDGHLLLDSFKSALIEGRGHRICNGSGLTMEQAATAFVALHLAYCLGAALEEESQFTIDLINAGIPVAVIAGQANVSSFQRVLAAASRLIERATAFSRADIDAALAMTDDPPIQIESHAELAGAIAGYCSATRYYLGGHMIIDCGSATLDIVTFDLSQQTHWPIGIYGARIENLGADACELYMKAGQPLEVCQKACRYQEHLVYAQTVRTKSNLFGQENGHYPYQIILIGGGIHSDVHGPLFERMAPAFDKPFHHPAIAETLRYNTDCDPGRLILADGLARDPIDLRDIAPPEPPPPPKWEDPVAPGPEQC